MSAVCRIISRKSLQSIGMSLNCSTGRQLLVVGLPPVEGRRRQRHPRLHAPLRAEQLDLHVGGRGQIGLLVLQLAQLPTSRDSARAGRSAGRSAGGSVFGMVTRGLWLSVITDAIVSVVRVQRRAPLMSVSILMVGSEALPFSKTGGWPTCSARCRSRSASSGIA